MKQGRIWGTLLVMGLLATLLAAPAAQAGSSAKPGRIVFASERVMGVNTEIFAMNSDGSNPLRLTFNDDFDTDPAFSPDGRFVVFQRQPLGPGQIWSMRTDGGGEVQLTDSSASNRNPTWSPDGRRIAFVSERDGHPEIYVMNSDGSGETRLTFDGTATEKGAPDWSPDGTEIAFFWDRDGDSDIYAIPAGGGPAREVVQTPTTDERRPAWTSTGASILYFAPTGGSGATNELFTTNANVLNSGQRLTFNSLDDRAPDASQDGRGMIVTNTRFTGGTQAIGVYAPGAGTGTNLTPGTIENYSPKWENTARCEKRPATISGTGANENIDGGPLADVMAGFGGRDVIAGAKGRDTICGGKGKDKAVGGPGKDLLVGEAGKDTLVSGGGNDRLIGGKGRDLFRPGKGRDVCVAGPGDRTGACEKVK
jgi:Tol biopolymer transport system component